VLVLLLPLLVCNTVVLLITRLWRCMIVVLVIVVVVVFVGVIIVVLLLRSLILRSHRPNASIGARRRISSTAIPVVAADTLTVCHR